MSRRVGLRTAKPARWWCSGVRDKNPNEISISNARRNLNNGVATLVDTNGNGEVDLGETVVRIEEGGSWEYPLWH